MLYNHNLKLSKTSHITFLEEAAWGWVFHQTYWFTNKGNESTSR